MTRYGPIQGADNLTKVQEELEEVCGRCPLEPYCEPQISTGANRNGSLVLVVGEKVGGNECQLPPTVFGYSKEAEI